MLSEMCLQCSPSKACKCMKNIQTTYHGQVRKTCFCMHALFHLLTAGDLRPHADDLVLERSV